MGLVVGLDSHAGGGGDMRYSFIGGMDYASNLLVYAREVFKHREAHFVHAEASGLDEHARCDAVVSFGVLHYFPSLEYAREVVRKMFQKARKCVLVLDVLDEKKQSSDIAYKKQAYGKDYEAFYGSLKHLYYPKEMFSEIAEEFGFSCLIEEQSIDNYPNSEFRFNVIAHRQEAACKQ